MPLNFNITPYNDDYNETKHFYRILFRPSVAVQARELTQEQTILQQQLTYLGNSIYQHGSMVIPGQIATDPKTNYVRLQPTYGFIGLTPIPINLALFNNQIIQGETTGLQAQVVFTVPAVNTDSPTIYVKYLNTGTTGATVFASDEVLTLINSTVGLAQTETNAPTGLAISAQIDEGVYYIWGFFVRVEQQYLLLNKYSNIVSARVGLEIAESIVTPEEDPSLNDNAQGSNNYAAPGAHRYKIDLTLTSKDINDTTTDNNFVELVRLVNSQTQSKVTTDTYSIVLKELATRMNDANGDFAVRNFAIDVREHLDTSFVTAGVVTAATVKVGMTPATISLASNASAVDDTYNNMQIYLTNGSGAGQNFVITNYTGLTKTAQLDQDYKANQVADITTSYIISDPTKINRGIYPPAPADPQNPPPGYPLVPQVNGVYQWGNNNELAVGLESGRAYVDGYRIDTLSTTYVEMDKARDPGQAVAAAIPTPVGAFMFVKNLYNIALPDSSVSPDFLKIYFSNIKSTGSSSFNIAQNSIGTARVHSLEFVSGLNATDTEAVFKMYLFDINMNPGVDINTVRAFYCVNDVGHNYIGVDSLNSWGDVCTAFNAINVNGTGLIPGTILTGPSGVGTEKLVSYDAINNNIVTESVVSNGTQILTSGQFTCGSGGTATFGTLSGRTQIFNTVASTLIYPMPQQLIKKVRASDNSIKTNYYVRKAFRAGQSSSGVGHSYNYLITTTSDATFSQFNATDYMACVVADTNPSNVGKMIDLTTAGPTITAGGTQLLLSIGGTGPGGSTTTYIKLVATLERIGAQEKSKSLTYATIAVPNPTATMSLQKADIVNIIAIHDSGNPGTDATLNDPDIKNQYVFDTGQRDYFYDVGSVTKYPAAPGPTGRLLIEYNYFLHSTGDYFSVDSYSSLGADYYSNIPTYSASNGRFYTLRDCLDFRPRKDDGQFGFSGGGSSYSAPLQPSNVTQCDFQYWLSRIDKIYLDQYGNFNVIKGTSALAPQPPADPIDGMMLYTVALNPYTLSTSDMTITPTKNPCYTMHDIGKLEDRIANLEYYTNLNQLETQTSTYSVTDTSTGLDRFKNGFVVDNFVDHSVGNVFDNDYNCAVDPTTNTLRPVFVQTSNQMIFQPNASSGYVNRCDMLILPYTEAVTIQQTFATDIINVNPFAVFTYYGDISLNPATDTWKDTVQLPAINVSDTTALAGYIYLNQWSGATWGDWQTTWVGQPQSTVTSTVTSTVVNNGAGGGNGDAATIQNLVAQDPNTWVYNGGAGAVNIIHINGEAYATGPEWQGQPSTQVSVNGAGGASTTTTTTTTVDTTQQLQQTRVGTESMTIAQLSGQTINNAVVDVSLSPYIRSRRIQVIGKHFKPNTRLYPFFDGQDVSAFCRPYSDPQVTPSLGGVGWITDTWRWGGDYDPQTNNNEGTTSDPNDTGESAILSAGPLNTPIMTDSLGTTTLFFEIPCTGSNEFRVGVRQFRLIDSPTNATTADSYGDANYTASGILQQNQDTITSIYTPETVTKQVSQSQVVTQDLGSTSSSTSDTEGGGGDSVTLWVDPVAQSFLVKESGGCFVSSIDVFFQTTDPVVPITMQIRNMVNGYPGQVVVPFSEKVLYPNQPTLSALTAAGEIPDTTIDPLTPQVINISDDASVATRFVFDCPVYLNDGTEYAFVLIANSVQYYLYTAKIGGTVVGSTNIVSTPPYLGNLFKSQNASTWVADPSQNLKFTINKAVFDPTSSGSLIFTNSSVQPDTLLSLPFQTEDGSNLLRVYHKKHGMPKGTYTNSYVTLNNVAPGTYNAVTDVMLTNTFPINNVDLNSYTINVSGNAVGTSRIGPDGVVATKNIQFDSICPVVNSLSPTGTNIAWQGLFTSGKSVNNNPNATQEPYAKDQPPNWTPITPNTTSNFTTPRMIASDINETNSIVGSTPYDRKSMVFNAQLSTTSANLTPMVDLNRISAILINNQIDDPSFSNYTLQAMDQGITIPSGLVTNINYLDFDSSVLLRVVAVTGGVFNATAHEVVIGQASGAQGTVVSWDGNTLTLNNVVGTFQDTEAIQGQTSNAIGTVSSFQYLNTISNYSAPANPPSQPLPTPGSLDFSVFIPGYALTITGPESGVYNYANPVTILSVNMNQMIVQATPPFVTSHQQTNVGLTQYVRFVNESGPSGCTTASRYITRQFNLTNASNSLNILFGCNRPAGSFVDCYYRILAANSTQPFSTIPWVLMDLDATVDSGVSTNPAQFKDYSFTANSIGPFTAFSVKIVMRGGNSSQVPKITDFRGIALAV